jgi:hypothetical protein
MRSYCRMGDLTGGRTDGLLSLRKAARIVKHPCGLMSVDKAIRTAVAPQICSGRLQKAKTGESIELGVCAIPDLQESPAGRGPERRLCHPLELDLL